MLSVSPSRLSEKVHPSPTASMKKNGEDAALRPRSSSSPSALRPTTPIGSGQPDSLKPSSLHRWFLGFTAIGGLSQLAATDLGVSRILWAVLFVAGAVLTALNVYQVVSDFTGRPIVTVTSLRNEHFLDFPAVTLCNHNLAHCGKIRDKILSCNDASGKFTCSPGDLETQLCSLYLYGECDEAVEAAESFSLGRPTFDAQSDTLCQKMGWNETYLNSLEMSGEIENLFRVVYASLSSEVRRELAHSPQGMFRTCSFKGDGQRPSCSELQSGVFSEESGIAGVCYTFNFNSTLMLGSGQSYEKEQTHLPGPSNGLDLVLDLESDYYLGRGISKEEGVKVFLHDPNLTPLITVGGGYNIRANEQSNLALRRQNIIRQPPPFVSQCMSQWPSRLTDVAVEPGVNYQDRLCHLACSVKKVAAACGCAHCMEVGLKNLDLCSGAESLCVNEHLRNETVQHHNQHDDCGCRPMCEEVLYQGVMTTASWPGARAMTAVLNRFGLRYRNGTLDPEEYEAMQANNTEEAERIQDKVRSRMARLLVYYEDLLVTDITESAKYTAFSFLSSLGGAFSLYLGVSFVALFELVEIPLHLLAAAIGRGARRGRKRSESRFELSMASY